MTVSEFAKSKGVTTQAVSNQLKRYASELAGHVSRRGRYKVLDEFALDFLDARIRAADVKVMSGEDAAAIADLRGSVAQLQQHLIDLQGKYIDLQTEHAAGQLQLQQTKLQLESSKGRRLSWRERFTGKIQE